MSYTVFCIPKEFTVRHLIVIYGEHFLIDILECFFSLLNFAILLFYMPYFTGFLILMYAWCGHGHGHVYIVFCMYLVYFCLLTPIGILKLEKEGDRRI